MEKRKCPHCGAEVFPSDDVCMDCGADLAARQRPPPPEPARSSPAPPPTHPETAALPVPLVSWLWVPRLRSPARYPVLRVYQYVCMLSAWGSLLSGVGGAVFLALGWASVRTVVPDVPAGLDLVAVALAVGVTLLWSVFWAFTLRAAVEAVQVYLDIEENTRRGAEAAGARASGSVGGGAEGNRGDIENTQDSRRGSWTQTRGREVE